MSAALLFFFENPNGGSSILRYFLLIRKALLGLHIVIFVLYLCLCFVLCSVFHVLLPLSISHVISCDCKLACMVLMIPLHSAEGNSQFVAGF